ncbi:CIA30 family protein [Novipirellula artificiosorum]|uniref:Complex I intermediate-associated protein 30 (CIA30) n=1 Tax=Novipirellula artificiosorum TaxID=2528016 RepID=A0A5C6DRM9_9BACT|nr:CIA30 family protein [Novipirellula artificiosorum]TWU39490.1 Complex I intermediate-associated protein 30 (CIA30) [Novipirellula artificiosorum]
MNPIVRLCSFIVIVVTLSTSIPAQTMTSLFEFAQSSDAAMWQIVNDGVMGGRSSSQASIVSLDADGELKGETSVMRFAGNLSLENNGGFASVRSRLSGSLGLDPGETIVLRVKGDGRRYTFNLYTPDRRTAFSYQMEFDTKAGQWTEVKLSVDKFVAHSFGRPIPNAKLTPSQVQSVGILLGDKKPGPFEILIDWIKVE